MEHRRRAECCARGERAQGKDICRVRGCHINVLLMYSFLHMHCGEMIGSPLLLLETAAMGKTLPPFSQLIEAERRRWAPFTRALPKADQAIFDRLFDHAKLQVQAGVMASRPWPFETIVMVILLEQQKLIERAVTRLEALKASAGK
jgi:hypothetical protein